MTRQLEKGEIVAVPCRHCGNLSIKAPIKLGETTRECPDCHKETLLTMRQTTEGWRIWTAALMESAKASRGEALPTK